MEFIIAAPVFDWNSGGSIALHKLCHLTNKIGIKSSIYPLIGNYSKSTNTEDDAIKFINKFIEQMNPNFNTPLCEYSSKEISEKKDIILIYPEVIQGNPLGGKNVVRWLLHHPGFHTGIVCFGTGEYYIKYNNWIKDIHIINSKMSEIILQVSHFPLDIYNENNISKNRTGTAFCLRKGKNKGIIHDTSNSILIDGKSHQEIASIFKSVERFISYDAETAYSSFAALCGCESIVIPNKDVTLEEWRPSIEDRYGIAYGFENLDFAKKTQPLVKDHLKKIEEESLESVIFFAEDVISFFFKDYLN